MRLPARMAAIVVALVLSSATICFGQTFDAIGTRAQGMGGAFVAVADDASAVYWNPAGLAKGAYFSLLLDGSTSDRASDDGLSADKRSGWLLALSTPALGLSYYRVRTTAVRVPETTTVPGSFHLNSLVTHHAGITVVQSLTDLIAVGATAKLIRGVAASVTAPAARAEDLLDGWDAMGRSRTKADVDLGIMAAGAMGSVGLVVRNVTEPSFETGDEREFGLERQVRAGASILLLPSWKLAADVDLTKSVEPFGESRQVSVGSEGQVTRRLTARAGLRLNAAGDGGRTPAWSMGASYAATASMMIDAQATVGSDDTLRGWGVAGRIIF